MSVDFFLKIVILSHMEELTRKDIATILELNIETVRKRLKAAGILPIQYIGRIPLYAPEVVDKIRSASMGRPPKVPDTENKQDKE
jgi:predicted ArsR family transcriptional regulator